MDNVDRQLDKIERKLEESEKRNSKAASGLESSLDIGDLIEDLTDMDVPGFIISFFEE